MQNNKINEFIDVYKDALILPKIQSDKDAINLLYLTYKPYFDNLYKQNKFRFKFEKYEFRILSYLAITKCAEKYDFTRAQFKTVGSTYINRYVYKIHKHNRLIKASHDDIVLNEKIKKIQDEHQQRNEVIILENLAEKLNISEDKISHNINKFQGLAYLDMPIGEDDDTCLCEILLINEELDTDNYIHKEHKCKIIEEALLHIRQSSGVHSHRNYEIMKHFYGVLNEERLTKEELADMFGIKTAAVLDIIKRSKRLMKNYLIGKKYFKGEIYEKRNREKLDIFNSLVDSYEEDISEKDIIENEYYKDKQS